MKFSVNWLREFIDLPKNPEEIAELLTRAGIETEKIEARGQSDHFANHRVVAPPEC